MGSDLNNLSVVDKAEALFGYLEEFSKIRMKIVRNVSDYASDCIDLESCQQITDGLRCDFAIPLITMVRF